MVRGSYAHRQLFGDDHPTAAAAAQTTAAGATAVGPAHKASGHSHQLSLDGLYEHAAFIGPGRILLAPSAASSASSNGHANGHANGVSSASIGPFSPRGHSHLESFVEKVYESAATGPSSVSRLTFKSAHEVFTSAEAVAEYSLFPSTASTESSTPAAAEGRTHGDLAPGETRGRAWSTASAPEMWRPTFNESFDDEEREEIANDKFSTED